MTPEERIDKRKRVNLTVTQKLELIKKLERGASVKHVCRVYGVKKQTVSDIRKSKDRLQEYAQKYSTDEYLSKTCVMAACKRMKLCSRKDLDDAVHEWYVEQKACGNPVTSSSVTSARDHFASLLGIPYSTGQGWLWRFRIRHGLRRRDLRDTVVQGAASQESTQPTHDGVPAQDITLFRPKQEADAQLEEEEVSNVQDSMFALNSVVNCERNDGVDDAMKFCSVDKITEGEVKLEDSVSVKEETIEEDTSQMFMISAQGDTSMEGAGYHIELEPSEDPLKLEVKEEPVEDFVLPPDTTFASSQCTAVLGSPSNGVEESAHHHTQADQQTPVLQQIHNHQAGVADSWMTQEKVKCRKLKELKKLDLKITALEAQLVLCKRKKASLLRYIDNVK